MSHRRTFCHPEILRIVLSGAILRRSLWVALIVGTILTLINQGDALLMNGHINLVKVILTYLVPFSVSTYGAYGAYRALHEAEERQNP